MTDLLAGSNLLCSDQELERLKRDIALIDEATKILKKSNDEVIAEGLARFERSEKQWPMWGRE